MDTSFRFKIKKRERPVMVGPKPKVARIAEQLTGYVHDIPATQGEERFAKALDLYSAVVMYYYFRMPLLAPQGMPGWKELDFFISTIMGYFAVQIDGMEFVHRGTQARDALNDILMLEALKDYSISTILHVRADQLTTQEDANRVVRRLF